MYNACDKSTHGYYLFRENKLYVPDNFMHELLIHEAHMSGLMNTLVLGRLYRFCMNTFIGLKKVLSNTHLPIPKKS